jgi:hypothetical protein
MYHCPENIENCTHCRKPVNRLLTKDHVNECGERLTHCSGEKIGCAFYDKRTLVAEHIMGCPFAKLFSIVEPMSKQVKKMEEDCAQLKIDNKRLKREMLVAERFKDDFFQVQYRVFQLEQKVRHAEVAVKAHDERLFTTLSRLGDGQTAIDETSGFRPWTFEIQENYHEVNERLDMLHANQVKSDVSRTNDFYAMRDELQKLRHQVMIHDIGLTDIRSRGLPRSFIRPYDDGGQGSSTASNTNNGQYIESGPPTQFSSIRHPGDEYISPLPVVQLAESRL